MPLWRLGSGAGSSEESGDEPQRAAEGHREDRQARQGQCRMFKVEHRISKEGGRGGGITIGIKIGITIGREAEEGREAEAKKMAEREGFEPSVPF